MQTSGIIVVLVIVIIAGVCLTLLEMNSRRNQKKAKESDQSNE
jgi:flagellar basal body-associated protein FliL